MKLHSDIERFKLSWLYESLEAASEDKNDWPDIQRVAYSIPSTVGYAWADVLSLHDGIVLYRAKHDLSPSPQGQLVPLMDVDASTDELAFNAQIWVSGIGCHHEYWNGRENPPVEIVAFPGRDTFRHKKNWSAKVLTEGGIVSEMKSVIVPDRVMRSLLGSDIAEKLLDRLGLSADRPGQSHEFRRNILCPFILLKIAPKVLDTD